MTTGIYCLYYESNTYKYYIGQSINIENRYLQHCRALRRKTHSNKELLKDYVDQYPTLNIIEIVPNFSALDAREKFWITEFESLTFGYNKTPGGSSSIYGEYNPAALYSNDVYTQIMKYLANTDMSMQRISDTLQVSLNVVRNTSSGASNSFLQELYPQLYSIMIRKNGTRVRLYSQDIYVDILKYLSESSENLEYVAAKLDVSLRVVQDIAWGRRHLHLKTEYPELYTSVMNKVGKRPVGPKIPAYLKLLSPDGNVVEITGKVSALCNEFGLDPAKISLVLHGKRKTHKGWKVYQERK